MQTIDSIVDSGIMDDDDDGRATQMSGQLDSQWSTRSDHEDHIISENEHFHWQIRHSDVDGVEKALANKSININYKNKQGDTALHVAVRRKNKRIVNLLLRQRAATFESNEIETSLALVEENLRNDPENADLKLIREWLQSAQPGPSRRRRSIDDNDSARTEPNPKRPRIETSQFLANTTANDPTLETFPPSGSKLNFHGPIFQSKLLALFVKRALKEDYEFGLTTEWEEAEKFDDIVFRYPCGSEANKWTWRFVQAKHKQNTEKKKVTNSDLTSMSDDNDFSLQKYFVSYCKIKQKQRFADANFEDFSIITNTEFESTGQNQQTRRGVKSNENCYFVEVSGVNDDPILHINNINFKPKKFKLNEQQSCRHDLFELFQSSLFGCALKSKELQKLTNCKEKVKSLKNLQYETIVAKAKEISMKIEDECRGKKAKTTLLKMAKDLKKCIEEFLNENTCGKLVKSLNKTIETTAKDPAKTTFQEAKNYEKIRSMTNHVHKTAQDILNRSKSNLTKYNEPQSEAVFGLENEKKKLCDDEHQLQKIHKKISDLKDINAIKEMIKTENVLTENGRISKNAINDFDKENDVKILQNDIGRAIAKILTEISIILVVLNQDTFEKEFDNFFQQFRFITNYPNEEGLSDTLHNELGEDFSLLNATLVRDSFECEMINFLKEYRGRFYTKAEGNKFFDKLKQKVASLMSIGLCKSYTERLESYCIHFRNNFTTFNDFLHCENTKVLHLITELTLLTAIQVYRHLANCGQFDARDSYIFVRLRTILRRSSHDEFSSRKFILKSFQSIDQPNQNGRDTYDLCIIECRSDCRNYADRDRQDEYDLSEDLFNILSNDNSKKIVLIAPKGDSLARSLLNKITREFPSNPQMFERVENEVKFMNLDDGSQDRVLAKKVNFQGNDQISFSQLLDDKDLADRIIDSENLLKLLENEVIQIGDTNAFRSFGYVSDYYVDREFNLQEIPDNNSENIPEKRLVGYQRKVTLVANDSGMGKSTTLTSVARKIRELSVNAWIFRIDLNDHAGKVNTIKFNQYDSAKCIDFLSTMLIPGKIDANIRLQRQLFKISLENDDKLLKKPPIILLFDGFDEITPTYSEKAEKLFVSLMQINVKQLWVTTRPHEKDHLKCNLKQSDVFYLQPLKNDEQKEFLNKFLHWHPVAVRIGKKSRDRTYADIIKCLKNMQITSLRLNDRQLSETITEILHKYPATNRGKSNKLHELKTEIENLSFDVYIKKILSGWNKGVYAEETDFHGNPLNLTMLVEVICANEVLEKYEPYYLYDKFVNLKFDIYYQMKSKMKSKNVGALETRETNQDYFLNNIHNALAVKVLFPNEYKQSNQKLPNLDELKKFEQGIQRDKSTSKGKKEEKLSKLLRVGLLTDRQNQLEFIHYSYAEFFFSKYLMKHFKRKHVQRIFVEKILFERKYSTIRQFFNDQLGDSKSIAKLSDFSKKLLRDVVKKNSEINLFSMLKQVNHHEILKIIEFLKDDNSTSMNTDADMQ